MLSVRSFLLRVPDAALSSEYGVLDAEPHYLHLRGVKAFSDVLTGQTAATQACLVSEVPPAYVGTQPDCGDRGVTCPKGHASASLWPSALLPCSTGWSLLPFCCYCPCTTAGGIPLQGSPQPPFHRVALPPRAEIGIRVYMVNMIRDTSQPVCAACVCVAKKCQCVFLFPNEIILDFYVGSDLSAFYLMLTIQ